MLMNQTVSSLDRPLEVQIALSVTLALIIILAILGNTLVVITILRTSNLRKQVFSLFLLNLALTDIGCAVFVMPFALISVWQNTWIFGDFWCDGVCFFNYCFIIVSMATLAFISMDRFIFVVYPLRYEDLVTKRKAIAACCFGWLVGFVFGVAPALAGWVWYDNNEIICAINWESENYKEVAYTVTAFVVCFMFPMAVMVYAYYCIYKIARKHAKKIAQQLHSGRSRQSPNDGRPSVSRGDERTFNRYNAKAIKTILIMILAYALCNTPFSLTKLIKVIYSDNYSVPASVSTLASWLGYVNPCCNPIIYAINREEFRNAFRRLLSLRSLRHSVIEFQSAERASANVSLTQNASVYSVSRTDTMLKLTPVRKMTQHNQSNSTTEFPDRQSSCRRESELVLPFSRTQINFGLPGSTSDELHFNNLFMDAPLDETET